MKKLNTNIVHLNSITTRYNKIEILNFNFYIYKSLFDIFINTKENKYIPRNLFSIRKISTKKMKINSYIDTSFFAIMKYQLILNYFFICKTVLSSCILKRFENFFG
ncbi:hypothetical protein EDEG_03290 [Edhazardia aedis USNM 41457]|uniref:Uncharacterized protein n=1 Tax=Edhazardia aedis (strain USNM 41457) TaxID=1003232 RepID=J9D355_EDHAE|nr:hypothetical protein EDEG_03290 [Edhazardia aedis USNM 41457]|eukprot:EJW02266.1 hypothetical protein EDEG_03290 [Edhazardia aedis USNM 41457]